jgi:hypothetical protein
LAYQKATPASTPAPNANSADAGNDDQGDGASENGAEEGADNNNDDDASDSTDGIRALLGRGVFCGCRQSYGCIRSLK